MKYNRTPYSSEVHKDDMLTVFHIDVTHDSPGIHPLHFCEKCLSIINKAKKAAKEDKVYVHSVNTAEWSGHNSSECTVCAQPV